jgi:DNA-binding transcriptional LysR family regulator
MDFDQLNTFLEVARLNSFSRAAEKCFRTQPAVSAQIRALEDEVQAKLFDRSGGKVSLTGAGKLFHRFASQVMDDRRGIITSIAEMERVPRGEIIVGANEATCLYIVPEVFAEFKRRYPKVGVAVNRAERAKILENVLDNTVDFGIVSVPVNDTRLTVKVIHEDSLVLIAPPNHPISIKSPADIEDVVNYPLLLPRSGRTREALDEVFHSRRLKPTVSMEIDSSELLKRFVAANVGIGFIAYSNAQADVRAGVLEALPLEGMNIRRDLALVFRKDRELSRAAKAFIDIAVRQKQAAPQGD